MSSPSMIKRVEGGFFFVAIVRLRRHAQWGAKHVHIRWDWEAQSGNLII